MPYADDEKRRAFQRAYQKRYREQRREAIAEAKARAFQRNKERLNTRQNAQRALARAAGALESMSAPDRMFAEALLVLGAVPDMPPEALRALWGAIAPEGRRAFLEGLPERSRRRIHGILGELDF